ncbi:hypothetical protein [Nonomuraea jiangxiensis]|uniref:Uncharacterized protein n=1 Tax=Nonomuraea jiangxiensis TaxID=633440 RepID=A0A1G9EYF2_9ACTN|nr:hypothetical protein [Nonomuraea jiangxiensis]SDK81132.1 hypothetical protein SAMN05421869_11957 [Nonomuraea jiangxiensis]
MHDTYERPRFFPRQLVTHTELNQAGDYALARLRRHNRMMHGWGVVYGALVCAADEPWRLRITPGYLLDPAGNELCVPKEQVVDLRSDGVTVMADDPFGPCGEPVGRGQPGKVWVALRYVEEPRRPVRTPTSGCGCDEAACEYSRVGDGYAVAFLPECPPSHAGSPPTPDQFLNGVPAPCPPPVTDPWVVLAMVEVDAKGEIVTIDNCSCRRIVTTLAPFWQRCTPQPAAIGQVSVNPAEPIPPGATGVKLVVEGTGFDPAARVDLGLGVRVTRVEVTTGGTTLLVTAHVLHSAAPGDRTLTITNPDGSTSTRPEVITIA